MSKEDLNPDEQAVKSEKKLVKESTSTKILLVVAIILGVIIVSLSFYLLQIKANKQQTTTTVQSQVTTTTTYPIAYVPVLKDINETNVQSVSANPELVFEGKGLDKYVSQDIFTGTNYTFIDLFSESGAIASGILSTPWKASNNSIYINSIDNAPNKEKARGVISIHPISPSTPNFLAQNISLEDGSKKYILVAKYANIAFYTRPSKIDCSDVIIRVEIIDNVYLKKDLIYEDLADSREGWKTVFLNISKYSGKDIGFKIEGISGGPCGNWSGEWAAVDKFYVGVYNV